MGSSHRVVRKVTVLPGDPGRLSSPDPRVSASLRKREGFPSSSLRISILGYFERAAMLEQYASGHRNFRFPKSFATSPGPVPKVLSTGKLYGFPTVSSAPVPSHPTFGLRTRQKSHSLPRPREAIPSQLPNSPRCRCFRLARM